MVDARELNDEPSEGESMGDILVMEVGDVLDAIEYLLEDVETFVGGDVFDVLLTVLLT